MEEELVKRVFNIFTITFKPLKKHEREENSGSILRAAASRISAVNGRDNGWVIDKHANRASSESRKLYIYPAVIANKKKQVRFSLGHIRDKNAIKVKTGKDCKLTPVKLPGNIVESTLVTIDYSQDQLVGCIQSDRNGPSLDDFIYYMRQVTNVQMELTRSVDLNYIITNDLHKTIEELESVSTLDIKISPQAVKNLDKEVANSFATGMKQLATSLSAQSISIKAKYKKEDHNKQAGASKVKKILNIIANNESQIDNFNRFSIDYKDKRGADRTYSLLSNKESIDLYFTNEEFDKLRHKDIHDLIEKELRQKALSLQNGNLR